MKGEILSELIERLWSSSQGATKGMKRGIIHPSIRVRRNRNNNRSSRLEVTLHQQL